MFHIERKEYENFCHEYHHGLKYLGLRFGQAFHTHFKLEKVVGLKALADQIYEMNTQQFKSKLEVMIALT